MQQFDAFAALLEDGHPRVRAVAAKVKHNIELYVVFDVLIQPLEEPRRVVITCLTEDVDYDSLTVGVVDKRKCLGNRLEIYFE